MTKNELRLVMDKNIFVERKIYDINEDALYQSIKDLDYTSFMDFRYEFLQEAIKNKVVADTEFAKRSFWKRLMQNLKNSHNFSRPISTSTAALSKRFQRGA